MTYFEKLECAKDEVVRVLESKGIEPGYLNFGGAGEALARRPTVPTDARSEFLANRAMGDWAESVLAGAIRAACPSGRSLITAIPNPWPPEKSVLRSSICLVLMRYANMASARIC